MKLCIKIKITDIKMARRPNINSGGSILYPEKGPQRRPTGGMKTAGEEKRVGGNRGGRVNYTWKPSGARGGERRADSHSSLRPVFYNPIPNHQSNSDPNLNLNSHFYLLSFLYVLTFIAFLCFLAKLS